jgi:hypothetical protein
MTIIGSGQGGSIGRPLEPTPQELETTAAAQTSRQMMGIVKDSLEVPFTRIGEKDVWHYQSNPSRPTLPQLVNVRASKEPQPQSDNAWMESFKELVNQLPPEVREKLNQDMARPFQSRNADYTELQNALIYTAKGLAWLKTASEALPPENTVFERMQDNIRLPAMALRGTLVNTANIFRGSESFLRFMGPNMQNHDKYSEFVHEGKECLNLLENFQTIMDTPGAPLPPQEELNALCSKLDTLAAQFARMAPGNNLQILGPAFQAMAAMAQALSLTPASPSLFLGLKIATKGINNSESVAGMLGPEMEAMLTAILEGLVNTMMPGADKSKKLMLAMMILSTMVGANTLASLMGELGIGRSPAKNEADSLAAKQFGIKTALQIIANSRILQETFKSICELCGMRPQKAIEAADALSLTTILTMALSAVKGRPENVIRLFEGLKETIGENLDEIERIITDALAEGNLTGTMPQGLAVAARQAKTALNHDDYIGFVEACSSALELFRSSPELMKEDLEELKDFGIQVVRAASREADRDTNTITGMITAA